MASGYHTLNDNTQKHPFKNTEITHFGEFVHQSRASTTFTAHSLNCQAQLHLVDTHSINNFINSKNTNKEISMNYIEFASRKYKGNKKDRVHIDNYYTYELVRETSTRNPASCPPDFLIINVNVMVNECIYSNLFV